MATHFRVEVVTPERMVFTSDEATMVSVRSIAGKLAFMAGHIPYVGALTLAPVKITTAAGESITIALHGGIAHFQSDGVLVISSGVGELASEIDVSRARKSLEANPDPTSLENQRALLRLQVAGEQV